jgi:hypothetical protein
MPIDFHILLGTQQRTNKQRHGISMNKSVITAIGAAALFALTPGSGFAQEAKEKPAHDAGGGGHSHFTKIPEKLEDVWKEIHKHKKLLGEVVAKKDLGEAHDHAFAIRDLVKALPGKVPADSKSKAQESSKEIAKIAAAIDKSGAARAQKTTEDNVKKMNDAIAALEKKLKPSDAK